MRRVLVAVAALATLALPGPALAHGELSDARPGPGDTVGGEVVEVELQFEEELEADGLLVSITDPLGNTIESGEVEVVADVIVRVPIPELDEPGSYRVEYRIPSTDGFIFEGAYLFTYDPVAPPREPFPEGRASAGVTVLLAAAGTLLFAGGGWLLVRRQARRVSGS